MKKENLLSNLIRVKIGYDEKFQKYVAIKFLYNNSSIDNLNSFLNEIKILTNIHYKKCKRKYYSQRLNKFVKILDFGFNEFIVKENIKKYILGYYVMELAVYGELYKIWEYVDEIPENIVKYIFLEILEAIEILHQKRIFHRDLKPENLVINEFFDIQICDFGSSIKNKNGSINYNNLEELTYEYCAPEIIDNLEKNKKKEKMDGSKLDIFSLGCILFMLVVRSQPFRSSRSTDIYYQKLQEDRLNYWKIFEEEKLYNEDFKNLIESLLSFNPKNRLEISKIKNHKWFKNIYNHNETKSSFKYFIKNNLRYLLENLNENINKITNKKFNNSNFRENQRFTVDNFINVNHKLIKKLKIMINTDQEKYYTSSSSNEDIGSHEKYNFN